MSERLADWVRAHPVSAVLLAVGAVTLIFVVLGVGLLEARNDANRKYHRITVSLCQDVNQRVHSRRRSDHTQARADRKTAMAAKIEARQWLIIARQIKKGGPGSSLVWHLWASQHRTYYADLRAARRLDDHGVLGRRTRC